MKSFPDRHPGRGVVAGYAAKEFVAQSGKKAGLAIVTAENALSLSAPTAVEGISSRQKKESATSRFLTPPSIVRMASPFSQLPGEHSGLPSPPSPEHFRPKSSALINCFIATGSSVRRLKVPGATQSEVFYLRQIEDSQAIRERSNEERRAVVIGAASLGWRLPPSWPARVRHDNGFPMIAVWKRLFSPPYFDVL